MILIPESGGAVVKSQGHLGTAGLRNIIREKPGNGRPPCYTHVCLDTCPHLTSGFVCSFQLRLGLAFCISGSYIGYYKEEHRAPGANRSCSRGGETNSFKAVEFGGEAVGAIGDFRAGSCALLEVGRSPVSDGESSSAGAAAARETGGCSGSRVGLHAGS